MTETTAGYTQTGLLVGVLVSLVACKNADEQQPAGDLQSAAGQAIESEQPVVPTPMNLKAQIELSRQDLVRRLNVSPDAVMLSSARQVTWRSGALGCPEPGKMYTEALVPGSVIYLQADNVIHVYHAKFAGEPFYCPRERVEPPAHGEENDLT